MLKQDRYLEIIINLRDWFMSWITLALFIPACFALNIIPGPNNLLAMNNAQRFGFKYALIASLGRITAFGIMILLAATGLATVLYASKNVFLAVKIAGALYLFYIAYKLWCVKPEMIINPKNANRTLFQLSKQEFYLAAGNPKAILIFTAFLPQFINPSQSVAYQFMVLGFAFIILELLAIVVYALFGLYLSKWFAQPKMRQLFNRACASVIAIMGIGLLLDRKT